MNCITGGTVDMGKIYLLTHVRVISEEDSEDMNINGIYSTKALAEEAVKRKKLLKVFVIFRMDLKLPVTS